MVILADRAIAPEKFWAAYLQAYPLFRNLSLGSKEKGCYSPEDAVSILISLPHLNKSIITLNSLFHNIALSIELSLLSLLSWNLDSLSALSIPDWDLSSLNGSSVT